MSEAAWFGTAAAIACAVLLPACRSGVVKRKAPAKPETLVLWAWDRYEDLRFLRPGEAEVAGLLATIQLRDGQAAARFRSLPLLLPEGRALRAVVRLESDGSALPAADAVAHWFEAIAHGNKTGAIQVDFDARESQRGWYSEVLSELRPWFSDISITALSSWCLEGQPWFAGQPIREAVPMLFRMGPRRRELLRLLEERGQFAPGCRDAVGISADEPLPWRPEARRIYAFSPRRWTRENFDELCARLR